MSQDAFERPEVIGAFDKLSISVMGIEELALQEVQVDAGGSIAVPLAGSLRAAGLTPLELQNEIASRLRASYVRDPIVTVNMAEIVSRLVTVDGQVGMPGMYPVKPGMTLVRAVASARGLAENANADDVVVLRTVDKKKYAALYDLSAIRRGAYDDPAIYPNDVVVVGKSKYRELFRDIVQAATALTGPLIVAIQN